MYCNQLVFLIFAHISYNYFGSTFTVAPNVEYIQQKLLTNNNILLNWPYIVIFIVIHFVAPNSWQFFPGEIFIFVISMWHKRGIL